MSFFKKRTKTRKGYTTDSNVFEEENTIIYKRSNGDIWKIELMDFDYYYVTNVGLKVCKDKIESDGHKESEKLEKSRIFSRSEKPFLTACNITVVLKDGSRFYGTSQPAFIDSFFDDMGRDITKEVLCDAIKNISHFLSFPDLKALFKDAFFSFGDCSKQYLGRIVYLKEGEAIRDKSYARDFFAKLERQRELLEERTSDDLTTDGNKHLEIPQATRDFYSRTCQPKVPLSFDNCGRGGER